jgi:hypothetical protein
MSSDQIIEAALSKIHAHFVALGWRGVLTGAPVNRMTLVMPRGYELSVLVSPGGSTATLQQSQMVTTKGQYGVLVSFVKPGAASKTTTFGLTPGTVEKTADLIVGQIESSAAQLL